MSEAGPAHLPCHRCERGPSSMVAATTPVRGQEPLVLTASILSVKLPWTGGVLPDLSAQRGEIY